MQPLRKRVQRLARVGHLLADQVAELDTALQARDEFLAMVSHELRTPLTVLLGDLSILKRQADIAPSGAQIVQDMEVAALRLQSILENLLTLARLEAIETESEPVLLQHVAEDAIREFEKVAPDRAIKRQWPEDMPPVAANEGHVRQVMHNLLTNAHKYSPPEAPIEVEGRRDGQSVVVCVRDRGGGIAPDEYERIFTPFFRGASARGAAGVGLGLTVCLRLVQMHGGRIWLHHSRPTEGTEFRFSFPIAES